jgi:hypothetical protein
MHSVLTPLSPASRLCLPCLSTRVCGFHVRSACLQMRGMDHTATFPHTRRKRADVIHTDAPEKRTFHYGNLQTQGWRVSAGCPRRAMSVLILRSRPRVQAATHASGNRAAATCIRLLWKFCNYTCRHVCVAAPIDQRRFVAESRCSEHAVATAALTVRASDRADRRSGIGLAAPCSADGKWHSCLGVLIRGAATVQRFRGRRLVERSAGAGHVA